MNKIKIEPFKIVLILILLGFLFVFFQFTQNGRYQNNTDTRGCILDTRNGSMYKMEYGKTILSMSAKIE
ncbi:MAG: hypothetical protein HQ510_12745 [Candidatus Marinimicrobia bacterium]|nr:hypothetical protein [Candidatus Neomarinimicrobiota bacterium]